MPFKFRSDTKLATFLASLPCFRRTKAISDPVREGFISFPYMGERYQTYYKCFGEPKGSARPPLVVLHGGPGLVHNYLIPLADLTDIADIPVILYDQVGNGRSTHLRDKPTSFWTIELFIEELLNLLRYFGIESSFNLLGHSWGGALASEFEIRRQPAGLRHLILTNSLASSTSWSRANAELLRFFPETVREGMNSGMTDPSGFYAALSAFHEVHGCRQRPLPQEYIYTLDQVFREGGDPTVAAAPILKDWSIVDKLDRVRVPTLVINGRYDISQDFVVSPFFQRIKSVKWITFELSSHSPFWEEKEKYMQTVDMFLRS
ncbi:proline iminopeptidase [Heliocybe sulcata]|uniref:Proline iminopeptidase n=1 Tax=Heliocybe sulcata TaxID=5364 RepID=A0A5C3NDQ7_9AGAM|nr:proline iminopeptidase [Heliocybe sulcata]